MSHVEYPMVCRVTGKTVDLAAVTVKARYADCSVFDCPACKARNVDDRLGVHFNEPPRDDRWFIGRSGEMSPR
jgi:hypothetical protein